MTNRRAPRGFARVALLLAVLAALAPGVGRGAELAPVVGAGAEAAGNPYLFGIAGHAWWLDPAVYGDQLLPALDDLGVTTVRLSIDWRRFEPERGVWDWAMYDRVLGELARRNIVVVADFNTIPPWASVDVAGCADADQEIHACQLRQDMEPAFEEAIRAALTRYAWIDHWEFWNEPEMWHSFGGSDYLRYLRTFYDVAHALNPEVKVAACTLAGPEYIQYLYNVSGSWYGPGKQPWDAVAYHPYNVEAALGPDGEPLPIHFDRVLALRQIMVKEGDGAKPIWITEYGWNNGSELQARNLRAVLDWMRTQPYIEFAHLHMLHDWSDEEQGRFGLLGIVPDASGARRLTPDTRFVPKQPFYDAFKDYPRDGLPAAPSGGDVLAFAETGHTLRGRFLAAWQARGGLPILGYPLTRPYPARQANGSWLLVQDFERGRLEYHPERRGTPGEVLGALSGVEATAGRRSEPPFAPLPGCTPGPERDCFAETGHSLAGGFRAYWHAFGGLAVFGYPISEEFTENGVTVQYFERARFEWRPGSWPERYDVLLGLLGREALTRARWLDAPDPRLPTTREFH